MNITVTNGAIQLDYADSSKTLYKGSVSQINVREFNILIVSEEENINVPFAMIETINGTAPADMQEVKTIIDANFNVPQASGIEEAPSDNKTYGRKNESWQEVTSGISDAASDNKTYGRKNGNWQEITPAPNMNYSTTEINTGTTWIDGKPIYRKVISGTTDSSGYWEMTGLNTSLYLKHFIKINVLQEGSGGNYQTTKPVAIGSNGIVIVPTTTQSATPWMCVNAYFNTPSTPIVVQFLIILEYTKTTD